MSDQARHIVCPHCETANRIAADRPAREAKCGRCHQPLFTGSPAPVDGTRLEKHVKSNDSRWSISGRLGAGPAASWRRHMRKWQQKSNRIVRLLKLRPRTILLRRSATAFAVSRRSCFSVMARGSLKPAGRWMRAAFAVGSVHILNNGRQGMAPSQWKGNPNDWQV